MLAWIAPLVALIRAAALLGEPAAALGDRPKTLCRQTQARSDVARKYLSFDIETAKDVPGTDFNWQPHRPLGISCAAALPSDAKQPIVWHGRQPDGSPAHQMSKTEVGQVVNQLVELVSQGYTLLTWNGLGFDLDVLAEESGAVDPCRTLAINHVDMMFHVFCDRGFPVALDKAAQGVGIPGKPAGMSGLLAPKLWAEKRYQEVIDYVSQDVLLALQIAQACETKRSFQWITRKGSASSMDLRGGWLTVKDALTLPTPDTSWMDDPLPRHRFTRWLETP